MSTNSKIIGWTTWCTLVQSQKKTATVLIWPARTTSMNRHSLTSLAIKDLRSTIRTLIRRQINIVQANQSLQLPSSKVKNLWGLIVWLVQKLDHLKWEPTKPLGLPMGLVWTSLPIKCKSTVRICSSIMHPKLSTPLRQMVMLTLRSTKTWMRENKIASLLRISVI